MLKDSKIREVIDFHGHKCFGLLVGMMASNLALERLGVERAKREELVVISENDSCATDAIQFIAGATLGRGNLIVKDWGKHAYTFIKRDDGTALRIVLNQEKLRGLKSKEERMKKLAASHGKDIFGVNEVKMEIPPEAQVVSSVKCSECKEYVMNTRTKTFENKSYCIPCYEKVYIESSGL
jgi:formylmethanofuran dehydrogenase subunit E